MGGVEVADPLAAEIDHLVVGESPGRSVGQEPTIPWATSAFGDAANQVFMDPFSSDST